MRQQPYPVNKKQTSKGFPDMLLLQGHLMLKILGNCAMMNKINYIVIINVFAKMRDRKLTEFHKLFSHQPRQAYS